MKKYPRILALLYIVGPVLVIFTHVGSLIPLFTGLSLSAIIWAVFLYMMRMMGITAIYHRLIIRKSYQAPAIVKWVGSIIASSAGQMGPNWWKGHHIYGHHNNSDQPNDSHSPHTPYTGFKGFIWAQFGFSQCLQ